jgi:membrane protease YdiL (CAAX protease family)
MNEPRDPVWGWEDLGLFAGAVLPSLGIATGIVRLSHIKSDTLTQLVFQVIFYMLLLVVLRLLLAWKYRAPFWSSLGVHFRFRYPAMWLALGPVVSVAVSSFAVLFKPPSIESPLEELILDRRSLILVVFLGPLFEEIVFRGFLYPLFARSIGPWLAIIATAIPFALLHGSQSEWAWQLLVPIGLAGVVFGWVRYRTGSTAASTLVHMGYNTTAVVVYLVQKN